MVERQRPEKLDRVAEDAKNKEMYKRYIADLAEDTDPFAFSAPEGAAYAYKLLQEALPEYFGTMTVSEPQDGQVMVSGTDGQTFFAEQLMGGAEVRYFDEGATDLFTRLVPNYETDASEEALLAGLKKFNEVLATPQLDVEPFTASLMKEVALVRQAAGQQN